MHRYLQGAAVVALAMAAFPTAAQVVGSADGGAFPVDAVDAPTIVLQDQRPASRSYHFGEAVDSGSSTFRREAVEDQAPGSGDANEVLKALPTVQFSSTQGRASRAELQDLRPKSISISGSSVYENLFVLDGVGVNSRLDVSNGNADLVLRCAPILNECCQSLRIFHDSYRQGFRGRSLVAALWRHQPYFIPN